MSYIFISFNFAVCYLLVPWSAPIVFGALFSVPASLAPFSDIVVLYYALPSKPIRFTIKLDMEMNFISCMQQGKHCFVVLCTCSFLHEPFWVIFPALALCALVFLASSRLVGLSTKAQGVFFKHAMFVVIV